MAEYTVSLIALSGREQPVLLRVAKDKLLLTTENGKELEKFPYQSLIKWIPSHLRSKTPGPKDCLDIQIETTKGPRDLRMRCESEEAVCHIIEDLRTTVLGIVGDMQRNSHINEQLSGPLTSDSLSVATLATQEQLGTGAASPPNHSPIASSPVMSQRSPGVMENSVSPQVTPEQQAMHHTGSQAASPTSQNASRKLPAPAAESNIPYNSGRSNSADIVSKGASVKLTDSGVWNLGQYSPTHSQPLSPTMLRQFPPVGPARPARVRKELDLGVSSAARHVDLRLLAPLTNAAAPLSITHGADPVTASQVEFLEDMVQRLSEELARRQMLDGGADPSTLATAPLAQALEDGTGLPWWLKDARHLNPLTAAYDQRISSLEQLVADKAQHLSTLQAQVEDVVSENGKLHGEVQRQAQLLAARAAAAPDGGAARANLSALTEQAELLGQENELLVQQQQELEREIVRLHGQLEKRVQDSMRLSQQVASLTAQLNTTQQSMSELERRHSAAGTALRQRTERVEELEAELAASRAALEEERCTVAAAHSSLDEIHRQQQSLLGDLAAIHTQNKAAGDTQANLQGEVELLRQQHEAALADAAGARSKAEQLRAALHSVEQRLMDYQRKDAEVYGRIKDAMEMAEEARLSRDSMSAQLCDAQAQVSELQARLAQAVSSAAAAAAEEAAATREALKQQLEAARGAARELEAEVAELRLRADRLARERDSQASELDALRAELVAPGSAGRSRISALSLSALERVSEAERERDEALQRADSITRQQQRATREWQLERQQHEAEAQELKKRCTQAQSAAARARSELAGLAQQLDAAGREVTALRSARTSLEQEMRQQVLALRAERDAEVRALAGKLERALSTCSRSVEEAERLLDDKEAQLSRWKEEAQGMAARLERTLAEHRGALEERGAQVAAVRQQLSATQAGAARMASELEAVRSTCHTLQVAVDEAEARCSSLQGHLLAARAREEELNQELRTQQLELERGKLEFARAQRAKDSLALRLARQSVSGPQQASASFSSNVSSAVLPPTATVM